MQIVCPNCQTTYQVDPFTVGPAGRSVRCARCRTVWFVASSTALADIAASHRVEMAQAAATAPEPDAAEEWPQPGAPAYGSADKSAASGPVGFVRDAPSIAADPTADDPQAEYPSGGPLVESPALAPIEQAPADSPGQAEDIETVAARRARKEARYRRFRLPLPGLATAILMLILLDLGAIGWRAEIVRLVPQTASLYAAIGLPVNLRGLVLTDVTTETLTNDGAQVLLVQGRIVSTAKRVVDVPRLRFAIRDRSGNEIYTWTALPSRSLLAPGETLGFQSRLASPPSETRDVVVRFFNRRDLGVGSQ